MAGANGYVRVIKKDYTSIKTTSGFNYLVDFVAGKDIDHVIIEMALTVFDTGGAAIVTTGVLNALNRIEQTVGNRSWIINGAGKEVDYKRGHGMIGELNRVLFGSDVIQTTDVDIPANGTEDRNIIFKLPVGAKAGEKVSFDFYFNPAADWSVGGIPRIENCYINIYAHYTDQTPRIKMQRCVVRGISPSLISTENLHAEVGYYIFGVIAECIRASMYEDDIRRLALQDTNGAKFADNTYDQMQALAYQRGGFVTVLPASGSTTIIPETRNEGVCVLPVEDIECVNNLQIYYEASPNAVDTQYTFLVMMKEFAAGTEITPSQTLSKSTPTAIGQEQQFSNPILKKVRGVISRNQ